MLRGARCPFELTPQAHEDKEKNEKIVSFKQTIYPTDPNDIRLIYNEIVLTSMFIEDVLPRPRDATPLVPRIHAPDNEDEIVILHTVVQCPGEMNNPAPINMV